MESKTIPQNKKGPESEGDRSKPRFRIQEAILILRQGKSHPYWREAAWHLMEHAGKDTQLLLEAQRDLIESLKEGEASTWPKYLLVASFALVVVSVLALGIWHAVDRLKLMC